MASQFDEFEMNIGQTGAVKFVDYWKGKSEADTNGFDPIYK